MMKWLGRFSLFILAQLVFLGIFLTAIGRLPARELQLAWTAIWTGKSSLDQPAAAPKVEPKVEQPSYPDLVAARAREERILERQRREVESLARAAEARLASASAAEKKLADLRSSIAGQAKSQEEQAVASGRAALQTLLETAPPKVAKSYLLEQSRDDENLVVEVLKQLEPAQAAKIFKEFKQPAEQGKLNGWLAKLGRGEPELTRLRKQRGLVNP